jgi:hypothetical protein
MFWQRLISVMAPDPCTRRFIRTRSKTSNPGFGVIKPIVAKTFPLTETVNALRYLVEGRPIGMGRPNNLRSSKRKNKT